MSSEVKKIVVIGPESTGKSTLAEQLAEHYNTLWVPEYAREYLKKNGTDYTYDDLLTIAKGQIGLEEEILSTVNSRRSTGRHHADPLTVDRRPWSVFIDTDMYVIKVWSEYVFNQCNSWVLNQVANRNYDLYLLCNADLPWVKDELREYPDLKTRNKLYHYYKDHMVNQKVPWVDISGDYDVRLQKAITTIEAL